MASLYDAIEVTVTSNLPVKYNSFLLRFGIGHLHIADQQPVNWSTLFVQVYLHLQRRAGVNVQFTINDTATLTYTNLEHGNWRVFRQRSGYFQVPVRQ